MDSGGVAFPAQVVTLTLEAMVEETDDGAFLASRAGQMRVDFCVHAGQDGRRQGLNEDADGRLFVRMSFGHHLERGQGFLDRLAGNGHSILLLICIQIRSARKI